MHHVRRVNINGAMIRTNTGPLQSLTNKDFKSEELIELMFSESCFDTLKRRWGCSCFKSHDETDSA